MFEEENDIISGGGRLLKGEFRGVSSFRIGHREGTPVRKDR